MGFKKMVSSIFKPKPEENFFVPNGGKLLEGLIALTNGRYDVPIRTFTAKEINKATSNFAHHCFGGMYRGHLERRHVLVARFRHPLYYNFSLERAINDIVFGSQMSHLKNVLKLIGCCLEFKVPVSVYELVEGYFLSDLLFVFNNNGILSWRNRIKIASDIARTISYLHDSFEAPAIYGGLHPSKVFIDQHGVAKLFDFSLCISIPPGELGVEKPAAGILGTAVFVDPTYMNRRYVTQRADVFGFGMVCLTLLTGKCTVVSVGDEVKSLLDYVKYWVDNHQCDKIIDPRIVEEIREVGSESVLQSFLDLSLECTQYNPEDRLDMIDVAKQLRVLEKSFPSEDPGQRGLIK